MFCQGKFFEPEKHTNLDVSAGIQENVVALDIAVDDVLRVKMVEALAGLS
jgi:hypothetical protein